MLNWRNKIERNNEPALKKRLAQIEDYLGRTGTAVVNRWSLDKKSEQGIHRFFRNRKMKADTLIESIKQRCCSNCPTGHVLVIQDSTELNYNHLEGKLKVNDADIGLLSDNKSLGFLAHPSLAVDADSEVPFGLSEVLLFQRPIGMADKTERDYQSLAIEDKESYKWLLSAQNSKACLKAARELTIIADRESDIYELFCQIPDNSTHLIIRSNYNRRVEGGQNIKQVLSQKTWEDGLKVKVCGHKNRTSRQADLRFRWASVEILRPESSAVRRQALKQYPASVALQVIEIEENAQTVPQGEQPIHWILWTTHQVEFVQQAIQIGKWYANRWWIEDLFRVIKTQGFEVESSQFGSGQALKKLAVACLDQGWKVLLMRQERTGRAAHPASLCFSSEEQQFLNFMQPQLEGPTKKQQNPHEVDSLAWAVWLIARLGGWKPADLDKRPPGVITLARGLTNFYERFQGWKMALDFFNQKTNSDP